AHPNAGGIPGKGPEARDPVGKDVTTTRNSEAEQPRHGLDGAFGRIARGSAPHRDVQVGDHIERGGACGAGGSAAQQSPPEPGHLRGSHCAASRAPVSPVRIPHSEPTVWKLCCTAKPGRYRDMPWRGHAPLAVAGVSDLDRPLTSAMSAPSGVAPGTH